MSLLIVLRSPALGYCPDSEVFFFGDFECHLLHCHDHHDDDHHHCEDHNHSPCEENHEMISLESDDFLWNGMAETGGEKISTVGELNYDPPVTLDRPKRPSAVISPPRAPPPPGSPVFLRFSVLRL